MINVLHSLLITNDTSRVKADLLSPTVSHYHDTDETIQEITINTKDD